MKYKKALFMLLELFLRVVINPRLRAFSLRLCGAHIGHNVRIYEVQFLNLENGFDNLHVEDDVHIGMGCKLDLAGNVFIKKGVTLSPGVTILTHSDPGKHHSSPICSEFGPFVSDVIVGEFCWVGASVTVLAGSVLEDRIVVGACSLVKGKLESSSLYYGIPATKARCLNLG